MSLDPGRVRLRAALGGTMTASDRVRAITEIADAMEGEPYSDLGLTLNEFGLLVPEEWSGNKRADIINTLTGQTDERILALYAHVMGPHQPDSARVAVADRKLPWDDSQFRLFASHRAEDKALVGELKKHLAWQAIDLFVAHVDIQPTKEWLDEIDLALDSCDAAAAILTPNFHGSDWCDQEIGYAIRRRVLILPVCLGVTPYGFMNRYQGLRAEKLSPPEIATSIFDILNSNELTAGRLDEAIVAFVAEAQSFDQANHGSKLLRRVTRWTPPLLRKLEESLESNSQVSGAYSAPGRIKAIIARNSS